MHSPSRAPRLSILGGNRCGPNMRVKPAPRDWLFWARAPAAARLPSLVLGTGSAGPSAKGAGFQFPDRVQALRSRAMPVTWPSVRRAAALAAK